MKSLQSYVSEGLHDFLEPYDPVDRLSPEDKAVWEKIKAGFPEWFKKTVNKPYLNSLVEKDDRAYGDLLYYDDIGACGLGSSVKYYGGASVKGNREMMPRQAAKALETSLAKYAKIPETDMTRSWMSKDHLWIRFDALAKAMNLK